MESTTSSSASGASSSSTLYQEWGATGGCDACIFCSWTASPGSFESHTAYSHDGTLSDGSAQVTQGPPAKKRVKRDEKEGIIQRETQFDTNLVLARPTTLEVYTLQPRGINGRGDPNLTEVGDSTELVLEESFALFDRVASFSVLRLKGALAKRATGLNSVTEADALVVSFKLGKIAVVSFDVVRRRLQLLGIFNFEANATGLGAHIRATASVRLPTGASSTGMVRMDPHQRCLVMIMYEDQLAVLPLAQYSESRGMLGFEDEEEEDDEEGYGVESTEGQQQKSNAASLGDIDFVTDYSSRLFRPPLVVPFSSIGEGISGETKDYCFLRGYIDPTVAILHEPTPTNSCRLTHERYTCQLTAVTLDLETGRHPVVWTVPNLPHDALNLVPVETPIGGVIVLCTNAILYLSQQQMLAQALNGFAPATTYHHSRFRLQPPPEDISIELDSVRWEWVSGSQLILTIQEGYTYVVSLQKEEESNLVQDIIVRDTGLALNTVHCIASALKRWMFFGSRVSDSLLLTVVPQTIFSAAEKLRCWARIRKLDWKKYLQNENMQAIEDVQSSREALGRALQSHDLSSSEQTRRLVAREMCLHFRGALEEEFSARTGGILASGRAVGSSSIFSTSRSIMIDGNKVSSSSERFETANELVFMVHDILPVASAVGDTTHSLSSRGDLEDKQLPGAPRASEIITTCGNNRDGGFATFSRSFHGTVLSRLTMPECVGVWTLPIDIPQDVSDTTDLTSPPEYVGSGDDFFDPEFGEYSVPWMHRLVIITTETKTRVLVVQDNQLEELKQKDTEFLLDVPTLAAGPLLGGRRLAQVNTKGVRIVNSLGGGFEDLLFYYDKEYGGLGLSDGDEEEYEYVTRAHICDPYIALELNTGKTEILKMDKESDDEEEELRPAFASDSRISSRISGSDDDPIVAVSLYRDNGSLRGGLGSKTSKTFEPDWLDRTLEFYDNYFLRSGQEEAPTQDTEAEAEKQEFDEKDGSTAETEKTAPSGDDAGINSATDDDYDSEDEALYGNLGSSILDFERMTLGEMSTQIASGDVEDEEKVLYGEDGWLDIDKQRSSNRKRDRSVQIDLSGIGDDITQMLHDTTLPSYNAIRQAPSRSSVPVEDYQVYAVVCRRSGLTTVENLSSQDPEHSLDLNGVIDGLPELSSDPSLGKASSSDEIAEVNFCRLRKLTLTFRMKSGMVYIYQGKMLPPIDSKNRSTMKFTRATQHLCDAQVDASSSNSPCVLTEKGNVITLPQLQPFSNLGGWRGIAILGRRPAWALEQRGAVHIIPLHVPDVGPGGVHRSNLVNSGENPLDVTPMQIKEGMGAAARAPPGSSSARDFPVTSIAPLNSFLSRNGVVLALPGQASCCVMQLPAPHSLQLHNGAVSSKGLFGCGIHKLTFLHEGSRVPGTSTTTIQPPTVQQWQKQKSLLAQSGRDARMRLQAAWQDAAVMENDNQTAAAGTSVMSYIREENAQSKYESSSQKASSFGGELKSNPLFACLVSYSIPRDIDEEARYEVKRISSLGSEYVQLDFGEHKELTKPDPQYGGQPLQMESVHEIILARRQQDLLPAEQLVATPGKDGIRSWAPYSHYDDIITDEEAHTHEISNEERIQLKREKSEDLKKTTFDPVSRDGPETVADLYAAERFDDQDFVANIRRHSMDYKVFNKLLNPAQRKFNAQVLSDPSDFVCVDRFPLMRYEHGLVVREAALADAPGARKESFVIVGTGFVPPRGEDEDGQGRLIVFKVAYVNAEIEGTSADSSSGRQTVLVPKLKYLLDYNQEAPVSAVSCITVEGRDYIVMAAGRLVEIHKWEYGRLHKVGFYDAAIYPTDLTTVKNYIVMGDLFQSVRLLCWRPQQWDLSLLAKDTSPSHTISSSTFVHGERLGIVSTDMDRNLSIFSYNPKTGTRLFCHGDIHVLSPIMDANPVRLLRSTLEEQEVEYRDKTIRFGIALCNLDGGVSMLIPVDHETFQRLLMLQKLLNYAIPHTAGVNPRQARRFTAPDNVKHIPVRGIIDGPLIWRFLEQTAILQDELASAIGTSRETLYSDLLECERCSVAF